MICMSSFFNISARTYGSYFCISSRGLEFTWNPLDGDTSFIGFITHRSVQSYRKAVKLTRHRQ